jgi:DNA-binding transcriptional MerR regulator
VDITPQGPQFQPSAAIPANLDVDLPSHFSPDELPATVDPVSVDPGGFDQDQSVLFDGDALRPEAVHLGYRGPVACSAAGITYRQLDYWARTGLVMPSIRSAAGSGTARLYSFRDILILRIVKRLIDTGVSLPNIRAAVTHLESRGGGDLARITLMSDGATIYECRSADEVVDLVRGGQGVFGIAVGRVWQEVEGNLARLPGERTDGAGFVPADESQDELAARRVARRTAG